MQFGRFEIFQLSEGLFQLTGSLMQEFTGESNLQGKVPGIADRLLISINVVVLRGAHQVILCDTGIGSKHRDLTCELPSPRGRARPVREQLQLLGIQPDEVSHILMTHLHYDHAGGLSCVDERGDVSCTFPRAEVFIQEEEWQAAQQAVYKGTRGYLTENWGILQDSPRLQIVDGDESILEGITLIKTGGHTRGHQIVRIDSGEGRTAGVFGDMIPTPSYFHKTLKMKFDYDPEESKTVRAGLVDRALEEEWLLFFYHAPVLKAGKGVRREGRIQVMKFSQKDLWPVTAETGSGRD